MRRISLGADPDSAPRTVTLPATWEDSAAAALAELAPGDGAVSVEVLADTWLQRFPDDEIRQRLAALLRERRMAPAAPVWRGYPALPLRFVLNLAGFYAPGDGFDIAAYLETIGIAASLEAELALSGLADLLARCGLDYDSQAARDVAHCLFALARGAAPEALTLFSADWRRNLPPSCAIAGLAEAAVAASNARGVAVCVTAPGAVDALLGIETGGIAPSFAPITAEGTLSRASRECLAARAISAEAALAALYAGQDKLPSAGIAAYAAMHDAVAAYAVVMPARPNPAPAPRETAHSTRRELPDRHNGYTQKVTIGGHRLFLRTGEYADGTLGEVTVTLPRETAATRALMESVALAISIGLQHGVKLQTYVEALAGTRFGPSGKVEGDSAVSEAESVLDYVMRHLGANYLGLLDWPQTAEAPEEVAQTGREQPPLLPLDLPSEKPMTRRRNLRLVSDRQAS
jgi:hypothetical protein